MITGKKIKLSQICQDNGIILGSYTKSQKLIELAGLNGLARHCAGFALNSGNHKYILFDDTRPEMEKRFVVAHELAHHLLGHCDYRVKEDGEYPQFMEVEANMFAAAIIIHDILSQYGEEEPPKTL